MGALKFVNTPTPVRSKLLLTRVDTLSVPLGVVILSTNLEAILNLE